MLPCPRRHLLSGTTGSQFSTLPKNGAHFASTRYPAAEILCTVYPAEVKLRSHFEDLSAITGGTLFHVKQVPLVRCAAILVPWAGRAMRTAALRRCCSTPMSTSGCPLVSATFVRMSNLVQAPDINIEPSGGHIGSSLGTAL